MYNLRNRSFLKEVDFSRDELLHLLRLADALKIAKYAGNEVRRLVGKEIALIFEKTSTRTRCAFEVAAFDQGAHVTYLDPTGSQMGHKESIADTAQVLGRMFDAIEYRGSRPGRASRSSPRFAGVPVYNGLTDEWHPDPDAGRLPDDAGASEPAVRPDQLRVHGRRPLQHGPLAAGHGARSSARTCASWCRAELGPPDDVVEMAHDLAADSGARITITDDVAAGVEGVDFVHTDVWVSMGEPKEVWAERAELLRPYQVNAEMLAATGNPKVKFMHCLPAFHDSETVVGKRDDRGHGDVERARGHRRGLPLAGQHRLRPGREPAAHDQGGPRRHARHERALGSSAGGGGPRGQRPA